jgi:photosystem II stability/assembly factor-like uncharacterized protein
MSTEREPATLLRDGMASEARLVTASPAFTERIIGATRQPVRRPAWQGWVLPAAAAALVAVLLAAALVGTSLLRSERQQPAGQTTPPAVTSGPPAPTTGGPTASPGPSASSAPSSHASTGGAGPVGGAVPAGFRAVDLTWISNSDGWALGTAPCGNPPCTSIVRTTDGGKSWTGIPAPKARLGQTDSCPSACDLVTGLRFATARVGYAFGPNSLFLTTDGGASWQRQPGGSAYSLEIVDGSALRVTGQQPSCAPGCTFSVQRASLGSSDWHDVALPAGGQQAGAQLAASGRTVVLATFGHTAGGAESATSVLFTSTDGGASWRKIGEPCVQNASGGGPWEVDTVAVTVAPDSSITGLCTERGGAFEHTITSTDGGAHFTAAPSSLGGGTGSSPLGAASSRILLVGLDPLYRSTDGGGHWQRVDAGGRGPGAVGWIGFESSTVGRVLGLDTGDAIGSTTVWTTTDAGRSWTASSFR